MSAGFMGERHPEREFAATAAITRKQEADVRGEKPDGQRPAME
jgi:hypothetical protein